MLVSEAQRRRRFDQVIRVVQDDGRLTLLRFYTLAYLG